jgi:hypothetical protein
MSTVIAMGPVCSCLPAGISIIPFDLPELASHQPDNDHARDIDIPTDLPALKVQRDNDDSSLKPSEDDKSWATANSLDKDPLFSAMQEVHPDDMDMLLADDPAMTMPLQTSFEHCAEPCSICQNSPLSKPHNAHLHKHKGPMQDSSLLSASHDKMLPAPAFHHAWDFLAPNDRARTVLAWEEAMEPHA